MRRLPAACDDVARLGRQRARIDIELLCRCRDQHGARRRAGLAQRQVEGADRRRVARDLHATEEGVAVELVVRRRMLDRHIAHVDIELFGDQHRQRRVGALSHLDHRGDDASPCPADRCARRRSGQRARVSSAAAAISLRHPTDHQSAADGGAGFEDKRGGKRCVRERSERWSAWRASLSAERTSPRA